MRQSGRVAVETSHGGAGEHGVTGSDLTKECYNELVSLAKQISECLATSYYFGFSHQESPQQIFHIQLFLSTVSSSVTSTSAMSSFTTSINPLLSFPVSSFLATPSSVSFSQYTHHLSSTDVQTNSVLPLVFSLQTRAIPLMYSFLILQVHSCHS